MAYKNIAFPKLKRWQENIPKYVKNAFSLDLNIYYFYFTKEFIINLAGYDESSESLFLSE